MPFKFNNFAYNLRLNFEIIPSTNFGTRRESPLPLAAYRLHLSKLDYYQLGTHLEFPLSTHGLQLPTATSIGLLPTCIHSKLRFQPIQKLDYLTFAQTLEHVTKIYFTKTRLYIAVCT